MTSMFDSQVRSRREHTPWARMSLVGFLKDAAWNGAEHHLEASVSVRYRPDVASRMWWTVTWTGEDGERREANAQEIDLALWRAAEMESAARSKAKAAKEGLQQP